MIFEQVATGGCQSYLVGCAETLSAVLIDPEISQIDRYRSLAAQAGLHIRYIIDTHTHADHFSAALRTNMTGGKTVSQMLAEAASEVPFIALEDLHQRLTGRPNDLLVLDVREEAAFKAGHIPGAHHLPRGQLELRINEEIPDPTLRIVVCCEFGKISTLAAATLRSLGFVRASALDGGMKTWKDGGYPLET